MILELILKLEENYKQYIMDKIYTFPNTKETKDITLEVLKSFIGPDLPETSWEEKNRMKMRRDLINWWKN